MRAVVRGHVQGVFFRDFTRRHAHALGITGYVRNQADGSVEVVAQGDTKNLERLLELIKEGPPGSSVSDVGVSWGKPEGEYQGFGVKY